jgi:hypothetical protein
LLEAFASKCRTSKDTLLSEIGFNDRAMAFSDRIGQGLNMPLYVNCVFEFMRVKVLAPGYWFLAPSSTKLTLLIFNSPF